MLTLAAIFMSSLLIALTGAMMPGPVLTATISESIKRGPSAGPLIMSGHALLEGALVVALIAGAAPLLQKDLFFVAVSFGGALILAWMSFGMFRSLADLHIEWDSGRDRSSESGSGTDKSRVSVMKSGVLLSIANPYWIVWWATIGLGLLARAQEVGIAGIVVFFIGHQCADFGWYSLVSTTVGKGRRFFNDRIYRIIIAVSAMVLLGFALFFAWSGVERLSSIKP